MSCVKLEGQQQQQQLAAHSLAGGDSGGGFCCCGDGDGGLEWNTLYKSGGALRKI